MDDVARWHGRNLPHWTRPNGTYSLTFRTEDSLPQETVLQLRKEFESDLRVLCRTLGRDPTDEEIRPLKTDRYRRAEQRLDLGHGACHLRDPRVAALVADAIRFFDDPRYRLHAWCVMPNHVHVLLTIKGEMPPTEIAGSWKKFSARRINPIVNSEGRFWQEEGFDHLVRGANSFARIRQYVWDNPRKAGLDEWAWVGGDGKLPDDWEARWSGDHRHA